MAQLDFAILANYAEAPPGGGLVYIHGGAWDTLTVGAPLEGGPPNVVALSHGYLAIRLLFHVTETNRQHNLAILLLDADGQEIVNIGADFRVDRARGLPASWLQGTNVVVPVQGLPLPKFGEYLFSLQIDGAHLGDRPFRVLKGY